MSIRKLASLNLNDRKSPSRRAQPLLEALEGRQLLAAFRFNPSNGVLVVNMSEVPGRSVALGQSAGLVTINGSTRGMVNYGNDQSIASVQASRVKEIQVKGSSVADVIDLSRVTTESYSGLKFTDLDGGAGNDRILGSGVGDRIIGGTGDDILKGGGGDDGLYGGAGDDSLYGGSGFNSLYGDGDRDTLYGDPVGIAEYDGGDGYDVVRSPGPRDRKFKSIEG